ncbi:DUF924 family protein [Thalassolituus sp. LLYu03]|uniref:DUF924 family protein n=1 Tax=Thalassolituus sp. LLYu03 TaxID=3421656 RepID=UPI003D2936E3
MFEEVLNFWFNEIQPKQWFIKDEAFDRLLQQRFGGLLKQAAACELADWREDGRGRLAEILVLDQFSRNIYRDTPASFAQDPLALALAQEAVSAGALSGLNEHERSFLLMPYMHSESRRVHQQAEILFRAHTPASNYDYELRHKAIIDRFGRYPHRNSILGREGSADEREFLQQPGSSF